jgi:hypothetical protein
MMKLAAPFAAAIGLAAGFAAFPAHGQSQDRGLMEVIVYGNDPCPRSTDADIVVCVRRGEAERYRIPEAYRGDGSRQPRQAWANRARTLETVSDTGAFSCSAVGPGGHTGCLEELIKRSMGERDEVVDASVPPQ